jgi:small subunit ribosomal protein S8
MIRLKNGYLASRDSVDVLYSNLIGGILQKLVDQKYIASFEVVTDGVKKKAVVSLLYKDGKPAVTDVQLASKPGQRKYVECSQIPKVLNGLGCALLTTTKGVLSGSEAKKAGIGGELLFTIW